LIKKIIFYLPLGGLQQQQIAITATADTPAAASNRKAYVWKMATTAETPAAAEMSRYASKSNSSKQTISLVVFFNECNTDCLQRKLKV
jgi:hypothetical protein